ncbi:MAG TPA: C4-type zinc ribbon domain-containing protein [Acidimicrobiales bacterium]|nr:C4-type zinc ribbon domain-containing protein [Acidimicrobiales bacterium]
MEEERRDEPGLVLLRLQDVDVAIDELRAARESLPERAELRTIEAEAAALERRSRELAAQREERSEHEQSLAGSAGDLGARIALLQSQVSSGKVSYRDQEALAGELAALVRQRDELEEAELDELTELDVIEHETQRLASLRPVLIGRHRAVQATLASAEAEADGRIAEAVASREPLLAQLPGQLRLDYERLRARLGGAVVGRVVRGACSGCHLALPATDADRMRHAAPGATARCEQCGRILVV